jgi:hypothetical protein
MEILKLSSKFRDLKLSYHRRKAESWSDKWYGSKFSFFDKFKCRDRFYYHETIYRALKEKTK